MKKYMILYFNVCLIILTHTTNCQGHFEKSLDSELKMQTNNRRLKFILSVYTENTLDTGQSSSFFHKNNVATFIC